MKREYANTIVAQYMERIYSYVSQRISNEADICDIAQDICFHIYKVALTKEIYALDAFIWKVAKHTLANYYRKRQKLYYTISLEEANLDFEDKRNSTLQNMIALEDYHKIRQEISYLSKIQRNIIIMFYYEGKKQSEIAEFLQIPLGTVKYYLSEAKKELKKGMKKMRNKKDLEFNPIEFGVIGYSGSNGEMGDAVNFFRSALSQNIIYCISNKEFTIAEIADMLHVSPIYIESELDFLEKYSLVIKKKNHYISNILIDEATEEFCQKHRQIYEKTSSLIACKLFDEISHSSYLDSDDIYGPKHDKNYIMWSLLFYLLAQTKNPSSETMISFDEVAELRADGGKNLITASIKTSAGENYIQKTHLNQLYGPCWNASTDITLWLIDGDWTKKRITSHYGGSNIEYDLILLNRFLKNEKLSEDDYAFLCRKHYIKKTKQDFILNLVVLKESKVKEQLLSIANKIKTKVLHDIDIELTAYKKWNLENKQLPPHLQKQAEYHLQHMFDSDGWFMLYAKKALVESGRLIPVEEEQKFSVTQIIITRNKECVYFH